MSPLPSWLRRPVAPTPEQEAEALRRVTRASEAASVATTFMQVPVGTLGGDLNPYSKIALLLVVEGDAQEGWITDCNELCSQFLNWERGEPGVVRDPECKTQTLIGKPLDVLVPPAYRDAHKLFRKAFQAHPIPRTMGEGRNTPIWIKDPNIKVDGLESITGRPATVLIGLSAMDDHHTLAMIQPMSIGKAFALPH